MRLANVARPHRGGGGIAPARGGPSAFNLHNQEVVRAEYQGPKGAGFTVDFLEDKARIELDQALVDGLLVIRGSSIEAVVTSTDAVKQKMRSYLDAHFRGSSMHGNNHRRVSNAASQSAYFNDLEKQGQVTATIYSKFGYGKGGEFRDFLLLHMRGGTLRPTSGDWLRIPARGTAGFGQVGKYEMSGSQVFFVKSKDGAKLFLLRKMPGAGKTQLLATLVKSLQIKPDLQGLELVLAARGAEFERHFSATFTRRKAEAGL